MTKPHLPTIELKKGKKGFWIVLVDKKKVYVSLSWLIASVYAFGRKSEALSNWKKYQKMAKKLGI